MCLCAYILKSLLYFVALDPDHDLFKILCYVL